MNNENKGWPRNSSTAHGSGLSTAHSGGLSTAHGGGLSTSHSGGLSTAHGGGLSTSSFDVYHSNIPPREVYLRELKTRGYQYEYELLKNAWGL
jgi:hypothetical protein